MNATPDRKTKERTVHPAKECSYLSMFVAFLIAVQLAFSAVPGVELVSVMLAAYSFSMGAARGATAAVAFALLRQLLFGFYPNVLVLYLLYYPAFAATFGLLGKKIDRPARAIVGIAAIAGGFSVLFTMMDNLLTPLWYGYTEKAAKMYFNASFTFMVPQVVSVVLTVVAAFLPLWTVFKKLRGSLDG